MSYCKLTDLFALLADLLSKGGELNRAVHVINIEVSILPAPTRLSAGWPQLTPAPLRAPQIKDNHEEALIAGRAMLDLCTAVRSSTWA